MNTKQIESNIEFDHDDWMRKVETDDQKILVHILKEAQMNQMHLKSINKGLVWLIALIGVIAAAMLGNSH
jgi:hypothetical protein